MLVVVSDELVIKLFGANMGEVIRFVSRSERERVRLIRYARAMYNSVFPTIDLPTEQQNAAQVSYQNSNANAKGCDGVVS